MRNTLSANMSDDSGNMFVDPYPYFNWLRANHPVFWDSDSHLWRLTRYNDVRDMLSNPNVTALRMTTFADYNIVLLNGSDPPALTRLRKAMHDQYMGQVVALIGAQIAELTKRLIMEFPNDGQPFDFVSEFARPLPYSAMHLMLGINDPQSHESLVQLGNNFAIITGGSAGGVTLSQFRSAKASITEWNTNFSTLLASRSQSPATDLIGAMAHLCRDGVISEGEAIGLCMEMSFASVKNVVNGLGLMLYALLCNPAQFAKMRANPDQLLMALNELLRYDSSVQVVSRIALTDISIDNYVIKKGSRVVLHLGAANRDPARFPDPDDLDVQRIDNPHLAFGYGVHYCIGTHLAWLELETAFRALMAAFPTIELAGSPRWSGVLGYRGFTSLPIRVSR